jgi:PKD repeat protein
MSLLLTNAGSVPASVVAPVASFAGFPLSGSAPVFVSFADNSTNTPTSWHWEKNDGSGWVDFAGSPTAQNPSESFAAGTWSVRLTATNSAGSDTSTQTNYITSVWTPALLSPLLWVEFGPSYCFSDAGGTVPCGVGDSIQVITDRSSHAWQLTQSTSGARPKLQQTAGGSYYGSFDGVNDFLFIPTGVPDALAIAGAGSVGVRVKLTDTTLNREVLSLQNSDSYYRFSGNGLSYPGVLRSPRLDAQPTLPTGSDTTEVIRSDASNWKRRVNGTQDIAALGSFSADYGGDVTLVTLGAEQHGAAKFWAGPIYGLVVTTNFLSDANAALLETYLAGLST